MKKVDGLRFTPHKVKRPKDLSEAMSAFYNMTNHYFNAKICGTCRRRHPEEFVCVCVCFANAMCTKSVAVLHVPILSQG